MNTFVQKPSISNPRGVEFIGQSYSDAAVEMLMFVTPYDLATNSGMQSAFLRCKAYLQARHLQEAAGEFTRVIDHPGVVWDWVIGALAHLQLSRTQTMMGDTVAAPKSYSEFLILWKDADPDIPIYEQAKAEYAKLQ